MKKIVIKIGSSSIVGEDAKLNIQNMQRLVEQISILKNAGCDVCLVTSGAIAIGVEKLGLASKPKDIAKKQACAAAGQMYLMQEYEQIFESYNIKCAQILLNHDDFGNRNRITHLTDTINALFAYGVVPVINENDALAVEEIKVGDNDSISAMISLVVGADILVLVSDVDGLYTANPQKDKNACLIERVDKITKQLYASASGSGSKVGTGGMTTKLNAGVIVNNANIDMLIMNKSKLSLLSEVLVGKYNGTLFLANKKSKTIKQSWLAHCATIDGQIFVDDGATKAIRERSSLLSCGITSFKGQFTSNDVVEILSTTGEKIAHGIVGIDSESLKKILKDRANTQLIVHANNIAVLEELI